MSERELPSNAEAERSLLAAILLDGAAFDRVADMVTADDFRGDLYRRVFEAMTALEGQGIEILTLREKMRELGTLKEGEIADIAGILDGSIPDVARVERYAEIVRDSALRRRVIVECQRLQKAAFDNTPVEKIAAAGADLFAQCAESRSEGPQTIRRMATQAMEELEARMLTGSWVTGVATGLPSLDQHTLGIQRGVLSLLGARPRVGKTAMALSVALNIIAAQGRVLVAEFDMSAAMVRNRILAATARVPSAFLRSGRGIGHAEQERIREAHRYLHSCDRRLIVDHRSRDIGTLAAVVRREAKNSSLDLVIVDHIGHVQGGRGEKRYLQVGDVSSRLIELADATGVAVLALVQLGRDAEQREPGLSDLRESGNLEQDARLAMLLDRPALRGAEGAHECDLIVTIAKNEGEAGDRVPLHFGLSIQRVTEAAEDSCRYCGHIGSGEAVRKELFA